MTRALVTGAGGFVGRQLVQSLVDRQMQVACFHHRAPARRDSPGTSVQCVIGDIRDMQAVDRAMRDVDWVFHLAASTAPRTLSESRAVNVEGTRAVANVAAAQPRPPVLVHVSSLAAVGPGTTMQAESSPCQPVSYYGRAKCEAEELLGSFADRLNVTIIRPPGVFGRGDRNLLRLFQLVRRGWVLHAHPDYQYSFLHVDDLVDGLIGAASHARRLQPALNDERVGVYFLADPQPVTFPELADMIAQCLGVGRARRVRVPYTVGWLSAAAGDLVQLATGRKVYFNRDKVREAYAGSWMCDPSRARREWGWAPACGIAERLAQTYQSFKGDGWL